MRRIDLPTLCGSEGSYPLSVSCVESWGSLIPTVLLGRVLTLPQLVSWGGFPPHCMLVSGGFHPPEVVAGRDPSLGPFGFPWGDFISPSSLSREGFVPSRGSVLGNL